MKVDAKAIAKDSGNMKAANMAIVGAASNYLPVSRENIEQAIRNMFGSKGDTIVEQNIKAFRSGRGE